MDIQKLQKLQAQVRIGGKGTARRKVKKVFKAPGADDKRLQTTLSKLNSQVIPQIEEVNMFKSDGRVLHFQAPRVQASIASNVFAISGNCEDKALSDLVPGILTQLGQDSLASLRKLAESFEAQKNANGETVGDDDVPDLVENFEEEAKK
ncbi:hypothetical protein MP638_002395 [Amoeboaphelidium occidentale]|nr:hypothetical protein MP638_002395 [Amoeboaphelidium occidentale]